MIHRYRLFSCGLHLFCCLLGVCNSRDCYFSRDVPCVFLFAELTFFICSLRLFTDSCLRCALNFYLLVFHKHYWCYPVPIELLQLITVVSLQSVFIHSCFLQFTFIYCSLLPVCTNYLTLSDTGLQLFAFWLIIFCLLVLFIY